MRMGSPRLRRSSTTTTRSSPMTSSGTAHVRASTRIANGPRPCAEEHQVLVAVGEVEGAVNGDPADGRVVEGLRECRSGLYVVSFPKPGEGGAGVAEFVNEIGRGGVAGEGGAEPHAKLSRNSAASEIP